jgi:hypothetical protein
MKVFVELPEDGMYYRSFAFFDTVTDTFDVWGGDQHWESFDELVESIQDEATRTIPIPTTDRVTSIIDRYRGLTPTRFGGEASYDR